VSTVSLPGDLTDETAPKKGLRLLLKGYECPSSGPHLSPRDGPEVSQLGIRRSRSKFRTHAITLTTFFDLVSNSIRTEATDFGSLLTEYSRSIIKSAIDHSPNDAEALKNNIVTAKEKVVVKHKTVENELKIAEGEVRKLKASNFELKNVQDALYKMRKVDATRIQNLEKQLKDETEGKERDANLLAKETEDRQALEVELADLKKDKKRKRESIAAIWEGAEKVKLV
jgi:hypothetical protein